MKIRQVALKLTAAAALLVFAAAALLSPADAISRAAGIELSNILIFIDLSGGEKPFTEGRIGEILDMYNEAEDGVSAYFSAMSRGRLSLTAESGGVYSPGETVETYLRRTEDNPGGFAERAEGGAASAEKYVREQLLVKRALSDMPAADQPLSDIDGDGKIDLITFIVSGEPAKDSETGEPLQEITTADIIWPHKFHAIDEFDEFALDFFDHAEYAALVAEYGDGDIDLLNGAAVYGGLQLGDYMLIGEAAASSSGELMPSAVCHELFHALDGLRTDGGVYGVTDLYRSGSDLYSGEFPVGVWDIMGSTIEDSLQSINAYYRQKLGWLAGGDILTAPAEGGSFTINAALSESGAAAVRFGEKDGQFFVAEFKFREENAPIDECFGSYFPMRNLVTGLVIYRVNTRTGAHGNLGRADKYTPPEIEFMRQSDAEDEYFAAAVQSGSFGSDAKNATGAMLSYYIEGEDGAKGTLENSRIVIRGIEIDEVSRTVSFEIDTRPDAFAVTGRVMAAGQPLAQAEVLLNGNAAGALTDANGKFTLEITRGDVITFFKRGYEIDSADTSELGGEGEIDLGDISAEKLPPLTVQLLLRHKSGQFAEDLPLSVLVEGEQWEFGFEGGTVTLEGVYGTDTVTLLSPGLTFSGGGSYPLAGYSQPIEVTVYNSYSVSLKFFDENGGPVSVQVYIGGILAGESEGGEVFLNGVAHGSELTFKAKEYDFSPMTVTDDVDGLELVGERKAGAVRLPAAVLYAMLGALALALWYYLGVDAKRKYRRRRR